MIRDVDLASYLPQFLKDFIDFRLITDAENPEFQVAFDETETIKNNQFILTANSEGLSHFESFFNLNVEENEDLEFRRSRLMSYWNDIYPYTYESLISKLRSLHGNDNFELDPKFTEYELNIVTNLTRPGQATELDYILGYMIPVNILVGTRNELYSNAEAYIYGAAGMATSHTSNLTNAYDAYNDVESEVGLAAGHSFSTITDTTNQYDASMEVSTKMGTAAAMQQTNVIEATNAYDAKTFISDKRGIAASLINVQVIEIGEK